MEKTGLVFCKICSASQCSHPTLPFERGKSRMQGIVIPVMQLHYISLHFGLLEYIWNRENQATT